MNTVPDVGANSGLMQTAASNIVQQAIAMKVSFERGMVRNSG